MLREAVVGANIGLHWIKSACLGAEQDLEKYIVREGERWGGSQRSYRIEKGKRVCV